MLKYGFSCSERSGNKSGSTFHNRIGCVDSTNTGFEQFERTWFFGMHIDGFFYRPFLYHCNVFFVSVGIHNHSYFVQNFVFAGSNYRFYGKLTIEVKRNHDFVRLKIFVHLAKPRSCFYFVAGFCNRFKTPEFFGVEGEIVFATLQKNACQFVEVVLQSVVVTREQAGSECYFEHVTHEFHFVAYFQTTCAFKNLNKHIFSYYFQNFGH